MPGLLMCGCGYTAKVYRREDAPAKCPKCGVSKQAEPAAQPTLNRKLRRQLERALKHSQRAEREPEVARVTKIDHERGVVSYEPTQYLVNGEPYDPGAA
jgi:hypothetical protein